MFAVRTVFLICRPLRLTAASSSRIASDHVSMSEFEVRLMKRFHSSFCAGLSNAEYLRARWTRDLKARSKVVIRFVVRNRMPW